MSLASSPGYLILLSPSDASKVVYEAIDVSDVYRVDFIKEIIDVKHGILEVDGFNVEEMDLILQHLCTS